MKWSKYVKFIANHPDLARCLDWHIGPPCMTGGNNHPEYSRRRWIEQQVQYLAIRPFESLNLQASGQFSPGKERYVEYALWFHIEGREPRHTRLRSTYQDGPDCTVAETVEGLLAWHAESWAFGPNQPLVLDIIVRLTQIKSLGERYCRESLEFYLVPAHFLIQAS